MCAHALRLLVNVCATAVRAIIHLARLPAIAHQRGNGIGLFRGVLDHSVVVNHVVPIQLFARQLRQCDSVFTRRISRQCGCPIGVTPVVHHLGHRRGYTTGNTALSVIFRTLVIVGSSLAPVTRQHRSNRNVVVWRLALDNSLGVGMQPLYLLLVGVQQPPHVARHVSHVDGSIAITQNALSAVITSHNDKGFAISVKHIVIGTAITSR